MHRCIQCAKPLIGPHVACMYRIGGRTQCGAPLHLQCRPAHEHGHIMRHFPAVSVPRRPAQAKPPYVQRMENLRRQSFAAFSIS